MTPGLFLIAFALAGCSMRPAQETRLGQTDEHEAVEVSNRASFPIVVKYYTQGGGPHPLGTVQRFQTATFPLPPRVVGSIRLETWDGDRVSTRSNLVSVRRFRFDPRTGEEIGGRQ
jgi:hypothetical protein